MGYESKVAIVLQKEDYDELNEKFIKKFGERKCENDLPSFFDKIGEFTTPDNTYVCMFSYYTKWYESYDDVALIMDYLGDHRHTYLRIGENIDDGDVVWEPIVDDDRGCDGEFEEFLRWTTEIDMEDFDIKDNPCNKKKVWVFQKADCECYTPDLEIFFTKDDCIKAAYKNYAATIGRIYEETKEPMPFDDFKDIMEHGEHIGVYYYDETYLDYSVYEKEVK